jgi:DNA-directed RNA polymerase subunit H (RpoH/RPB5)
MSRILVDKIASSTVNLNLPRRLEISDRIESSVGNVVVVEALEEKSVYETLELATGRMAKISRGDVVAGVLGARRALKGFVGVVPKKLGVGDVIHILNLGGVLGACTSRFLDLGEPLRVRVLGMAVDEQGNALNIARSAVPEEPSLEKCKPLIMVSGTCMSSGKTSAACEIIAQLSRKNLKIAGVKLSGVACLRDTLNMEDHGAIKTMSFLDAGHPSTADFTDLVPMAKGILKKLQTCGADAIVVEMGDGIIGRYGVDSIFRDAELMAHTKIHVMCANDLVGAWGAKKMMDEWKIPIGVFSGPATDDEVGEEYVENVLGVPAANSRVKPDKLSIIIERSVFHR